MNKYKSLRRIRKIKKFGKKVGIALIFLVVSYLLSLFSFYLYTQLSQILHPEEKGFLGFAIIGLIAGFIAVLVSLVNKRLILTVVISFCIDCLVDSVILYSKLGTQVIQYLPGLLVSMSSVLASWHFLKTKLGLPRNYNQTTQGTKEQVSNKYALARKLLENPNKITLEVFKEACELLKGIDPRIDALLKEADHVSRALTFLNGGDAIGLAVSFIKVKTEKDKEKKEKLLFFIDLVNDIWEEVNIAYVRLNAGNPENYIDHPVRQLEHSIVALGGPSNIATVSMAIVAATTVMATNTAGIGPLLPKNEFQIPKTQNSQGMDTPMVTDVVVSPATPSLTPPPTPTNKPVLTFSAVEKTFFVSAIEEGTTFNASSTGTYRFTITGGAYMADPAKGWEAKVMIYKNRPIDWSGPNGTHTNWNYLVGYPDSKPTREEAEQLGKGQRIDLFLNKDEYLTFIVFDSKGNFVDNSGGMYVQVQKATVTTQTAPSTLAVPAIKVDNGWGHFTRIFSEPPVVTPPPPSTLDYTTLAIYVTVHNNGTIEDHLIGGVSEFCKRFIIGDTTDGSPSVSTIINISIPAGSTVEMKRLGCDGVSGVKQGDRIPVGLIFEKFGQIPVLIEIRATPE